MVISAEPLIYGLIFIAVLVIVEGIYLTVFGKSISLNNRVNRRLEMLEKGVGREQVLEQLRKEMGQHVKSRSIPIYSILASKAQKANIAFTPTQLIIMMGVLGVFAFIGLTFGTGASLTIRIAIAVAMGIGGVFVWVNNKAKKRLALLEEQLPDAVELMVRSLRVGHPFSSAIQIVAKEIASAQAGEIRALHEEGKLGGVHLQDTFVRNTPNGTLARNVLGTALADGQTDTEGNQGGISGVERAYDDQLRGEPGTLFFEKDVAGDPIAGGAQRLEEATQGADLYLTVDQTLQYEAEQTLIDQVAATGAAMPGVWSLSPMGICRRWISSGMVRRSACSIGVG